MVIVIPLGLPVAYVDESDLSVPVDLCTQDHGGGIHVYQCISPVVNSGNCGLNKILKVNKYLKGVPNPYGRVC